MKIELDANDVSIYSATKKYGHFVLTMNLINYLSKGDNAFIGNPD